MVKSKRIPLIGIVLGLLLVFAAAGLGTQNYTEAAVTTFTLNIEGAQENPPVTGAGKGIGTFSFDDSSRVLTYSIDIMGIAGDQVTASHIHRGAVGVNGPVIYPLSGAGVLHIAGSVTLTTADVTDLLAGNLYFNVHSVTNPGGFARAQLAVPASAAVQDAIKKTIQTAVDAWNNKNVATFLAQWTDNGLKDEFDSTRAELQASLPEFIGDPPITAYKLVNITGGGNSARAYFELTFGQGIEGNIYSFTLEGGVWKISGSTDAPVPIPAGTRTVDMKLQEYAFVYDKTQVTSGNFAFRISNVGKEDHEMVLVKVAAGVNLMQALQSSGSGRRPSSGIEDVGFGGPWEPGVNTTMVFSSALSNGHYALLCFIPAPDDTPHAFKGMVSEFDVTGSTATGGGSTVRPPNTGDAGLLGTDGQRSLSAGLLALGLLAIISGAAGLKLATRRI